MRGSALLALAFTGLLPLGCAPGAAVTATPPDVERAARIASLEAQLATAPAVEREWGPYLRELACINAESAQLPGGDLFVYANSEQQMYDRAQMDRVLDPARRGPDATGPVATILDVARQLRERGIDFLVMPVPPRSAVYPELVAPDFTPLAPGELPPLLDLELRRFYLELEKNGVEVLDLLPTFLAERVGWGPPQDRRRRVPTRERLYMDQDPHWAPYGTRVAGRVLAERIRRYPWFPEVVAAQGTAHVINAEILTKQLGATAQAMVHEDRLSIRHPREIFTRTLAYIDGELWSFEDRSSPILLLGDSYVIPYWGFPDAMLRQLRFRLDRIAVEGAYQTSQLRALKLRGGDPLAGKRLVVWEFVSFTLNVEETWVTADLGASSSTREKS